MCQFIVLQHLVQLVITDMICLQAEVQALGLPLKLWMALKQSLHQAQQQGISSAEPADSQPAEAAVNGKLTDLKQQQQAQVLLQQQLGNVDSTGKQQEEKQHVEDGQVDPQQQRAPKRKRVRAVISAAGAAAAAAGEDQASAATASSVPCPAPAEAATQVRVRKHALKSTEPFHLKV